MNEIVVVGHQPQYMPYLGILHKISRADIFIIVDHVQFVRRYFYNRTLIKMGGKALRLTIPVLNKGHYQAPICEIMINHDTPWIDKHLTSIRMAYAKAPFFKEYFGTIEAMFQKRHDRLSEFTSELLIFFLNEFGIAKDIRFSSQLKAAGHQTELLVELTRAVGGTKYLSGQGAKDYFDQEVFARSGLRHEFVNFSHPRYPQLNGGFLEGMGCIDLLMNAGREGREFIVNPSKFAKETAA